MLTIYQPYVNHISTTFRHDDRHSPLDGRGRFDRLTDEFHVYKAWGRGFQQPMGVNDG